MTLNTIAATLQRIGIGVQIEVHIQLRQGNMEPLEDLYKRLRGLSVTNTIDIFVAPTKDKNKVILAVHKTRDNGSLKAFERFTTAAMEKYEWKNISMDEVTGVHLYECSNKPKPEKKKK
jgi:hypothetical protein